MRTDVLSAVAFICKRNDVTPNSVNFMAVVIKVCCTKFGISPKGCKEYAQTLAVAYRTDGWASYLEGMVEPPEPVPYEVRKIEDLMSDKEVTRSQEVVLDAQPKPEEHVPTIKEIMASIKPSGEPIIHRRTATATTAKAVASWLWFRKAVQQWFRYGYSAKLRSASNERAL